MGQSRGKFIIMDISFDNFLFAFFIYISKKRKKIFNVDSFVSTNNYFSSYYIFTALHGLHLLGGLFFWGKISSRIFKLKEKDFSNETSNLQALSLYWLFLFIVWLVFFAIMFIYNDSVIAWCKSLIS